MLTIKIKTDNAAFEDDRDAELARILRIAAEKIEHGNDAAEKIEHGNDEGELFDINGNAVGAFKITGK